MSRIRVTLIGAAALFLTAATGLAWAFDRSAEWESLEPNVRQIVITDLDQNIRQHFAHWQALGDFDYDAAFARYRQAALAAPDRRAFSLITEAFVASLNNGHTQFNDPLLYQSDPGNLGFRLSYVGGEWLVTSSAREELPVGSILKEIDGRSFESFYLDVQKQLNASNDRTRRSGLTSYVALFPKAFTLKLDDGAMVAIDRTGITRSFPPQPLVAHRWLDEGAVAYVAIRRFSDPAAERQARGLITGAYAAATHIVIDLRGNDGGNTPSGLGRALLGREWRGWLTQQPNAHARPLIRSLPSRPRYIVIIDRGCGSACEDFAMPFSLSSKAVLVGETTGGSSGQPKVKTWPNGMSLWVGSRRQWFPDGREFEGVGIAPDILIEPSAADFRAGSADRMLVCARAIAGGNRDGSCQPGT